MTEAREDSARVAMNKEKPSCEHMDCCQSGLDMRDCAGGCALATALIQPDSTSAVQMIPVYNKGLATIRAGNIPGLDPRPPRSMLS